jgi:hypothetical protein
MRLLSVCLALSTFAPAAQAYDSRSGDRLVEAAVSLSSLSLRVSQLMTPRLRGGLTLEQTLGSEFAQHGLSLSAGYEHHQNGWALVPRLSARLGIGLINWRNPTALLGLRGGAVWYPVRTLGVGVHAGATLWGAGLLPELGAGVLARF